MSDTTKEGPTLSGQPHVITGVFPNDATLERAVSQLTLAGFDHADLSIPKTDALPVDQTPNAGAEAVTDESDLRQARTLGTSMAGTVGAFAAAGATIATGGAAGVAIAAAAAVGVGAAAVANAAGTAAKSVQADNHRLAAGEGRLMLSVNISTPDKAAVASRILKEAGAHDVG